jgi:hypothetical protein
MYKKQSHFDLFYTIPSYVSSKTPFLYHVVSTNRWLVFVKTDVCWFDENHFELKSYMFFRLIKNDKNLQEYREKTFRSHQIFKRTNILYQFWSNVVFKYDRRLVCKSSDFQWQWSSNFVEFDRVFGCNPGQDNSQINKCSVL